MGDEDLDYMGDLSQFIGAEEPAKPRDARGTSADGPPKKRPPKPRVLEASLRESGLSMPLPETNIGFRLLQKMGYRPGDGAGMSGTGVSEPVAVQLKRGRGGLGQEAVQEEKRQRAFQEREGRRRQRDESLSGMSRDFKERTRGRWARQKVQRQIAAARVAQRQLTGDDGVLDGRGGEGAEGEGEGEGGDPEREDGSEDEEEDQQEVLNQLVVELRTAHLYCFFCGAKYDSVEELAAKCPGESEESHDLS